MVCEVGWAGNYIIVDGLLLMCDHCWCYQWCVINDVRLVCCWWVRYSTNLGYDQSLSLWLLAMSWGGVLREFVVNNGAERVCMCLWCGGGKNVWIVLRMGEVVICVVVGVLVRGCVLCWCVGRKVGRGCDFLFDDEMERKGVAVLLFVLLPVYSDDEHWHYQTSPTPIAKHCRYRSIVVITSQPYDLVVSYPFHHPHQQPYLWPHQPGLGSDGIVFW